MKTIKTLKERYPWKNYLITLVVVSLGAFLIHLKNYRPPQIGRFILWLPVSWLVVFGLMAGLIEFFNYES